MALGFDILPYRRAELCRVAAECLPHKSEACFLCTQAQSSKSLLRRMDLSTQAIRAKSQAFHNRPPSCRLFIPLFEAILLELSARWYSHGPRSAEFLWLLTLVSFLTGVRNCVVSVAAECSPHKSNERISFARKRRAPNRFIQDKL